MKGKATPAEKPECFKFTLRLWPTKREHPLKQNTTQFAAFVILLICEFEPLSREAEQYRFSNGTACYTVLYSELNTYISHTYIRVAVIEELSNYQRQSHMFNGNKRKIQYKNVLTFFYVSHKPKLQALS